MMSNEARPPARASGIEQVAGGYGPPGGGYPPPGGGGYGGGYGGPPDGGAPPGGFGWPPGGPPPGGAPPGGPPPGGAPPGGGPAGFGSAGGFAPPGGPMMPGAGGDVNTTLPLILNIVAAVLCGGLCVTFVLSILGIVFAVQGGNAKNSGDMTTARAKAKTSMLMFIITVLLGLIGAGVGTVLTILSR